MRHTLKGTIYLLQAKLRKEKINYVVHGARSLFEQEHIENLFACLKFALYQDRISLISYLNIWKGIGKATKNMLIDARGTDSKIGIYILKKTNRLNPAVYNCINDIQANLYDFYSAVEICIKYLLEEYKKKNENTENPITDEKIELIKEDFDIILEELAEYDTLEDFVNAMTLDTFSQETKDKLVISTVHSAKGTEAKQVYVLQAFQYPDIFGKSGFEDIYYNKDNINGKLILKYYEDYKKNVGEELRILYVALTRAKQKLILTSCGDIQPKQKYILSYTEGHLDLGVDINPALEQFLAAVKKYKDYVVVIYPEIGSFLADLSNRNKKTIDIVNHIK